MESNMVFRIIVQFPKKGVHNENVLVLIDTAGCDCWELLTPDEQSKGNKNEAIIVSCHVKNLINAGVAENDIAVITPYNLQVELIRSLLRDSHPKVEVRSVDGFQGREKEAVVMSLVRSNDEGKVGFLSENRRLNVAVTRARRHLCVVCDSDTVGRHEFLKGLIDYLSQHGIVRSAHEYQHDIETTDVETPESVVLIQQSGSRESKKSELGKKSDRQDSKSKPKKNKTQPPNEEENRKRKLEYEDIINHFVKSSSQTHSFPPNLNSFERRLIHEIAGNLGLLHESKGEGKDRFIMIKKPQDEKVTACEDISDDNEESSEDETDENDSLRGEYFEIISNFFESGSSSYRFPANLSSYERQVIHGISSELGLTHESVGEGKKRCIVLSKNRNLSPKQVDQQNAKTQSSINRKSVSSEKHNTSTLTSTDTGARPKSKVTDDNANCSKVVSLKTHIRFIDGRYQEVITEDSICTSEQGKQEEKCATKRCSICGKGILPQNFTLHSVQCEKQKKAKSEQTKNQNQLKKAKKNDKKQKYKENTTPPEETEDFDNLIAQFTKENNTCSHPKCKKPTSVIFQLCPFCRKTFCLEHHMAEVHGCGDQARQHARMMISKEGVLYPGSGVPSKKPPEDKRKQMQRKLDKKMEELGSQRKTKKPAKDKAK